MRYARLKPAVCRGSDLTTLLRLVLILSGSPLAAAADPAKSDARAAITALSSPDTLVRRAAVDAIQTLDDPTIPAACLPLLKDEGLSIRRQAARAIGSRFTQIAADQKAAYVQALETCATEGPEDVTLLCQRAVGLLTNRDGFPAFSVGPRGKWVLYERRRLPVVARTTGGPHRLLSPVGPNIGADGEADLLKLAVTSEPAAALFDPHWHPDGEALAFTPVLQRRFFHPVCVWVAGASEVKVLEPQVLKPLLPARYPDWGTTSEFVRWQGSKVIVRIYDCADPASDVPPNDPGVQISYDLRTRKLARVKEAASRGVSPVKTVQPF